MILSVLSMLIGCTIVVAGLASMLGLGGGVLYTPLQVYFGTDFHLAATTSLFLIMITSLSATVVFRKAQKVDWPLAIALESITVIGGLLGGLFAGRFSGAALSITFAVVVMIAAVFMIRKFGITPEAQARIGAFAGWRRRFAEQTYTVSLPIALPASLVIGAASGLVGVGGGILNVPLMVLLLGIPMDIAVASSAFMVGLTAIGGFTGHVISGHWDWKLSLILAAAVFIGGQIGARVSLKMDKEKIRVAFGWFLLAIAVSMILRALLH